MSANSPLLWWQTGCVFLVRDRHIFGAFVFGFDAHSCKIYRIFCFLGVHCRESGWLSPRHSFRDGVLSGFRALDLDAQKGVGLLAGGVSLVSALILAWALSRLVWVGLAAPGYHVDHPSAQSLAPAGERGDYSILQRATPFHQKTGDEAGEDVMVADAPQTTLNLSLHGVLMRQDTGGVAYISVGESAQMSYRVGDTIEGSGGAQVARILPSFVLIEREGRRERLEASRLAEDRGIVTLGGESSPAGAPSGASETDAQTPATDKDVPARQSSIVREEVSLSRAEIETLAVSMRADEVSGPAGRGFSVYPTRNGQLFRKAGLRPGDVIGSVDGTELASIADFESVFASLEDATQLDVLLVRGGERRLLTIRLNAD